MKKIIKHFLCLALLLPFQVMTANTPVQSCEVQAKSPYVYLSTELRRAVECLNRMLPEHSWSHEFKDVCDRIAKDGIAAPAEQAEAVVVECLNVLDGNNCAKLQEVQEAFKRYAEALRNGDTRIVLADDEMMTRACGSCNNNCNTNCNSKCIKYKGTKAFCNLFAQDLQVPGSGYIANLTAGTLRVTGNANITGDLSIDGTIFNNASMSIDDLVVDDLTVNGTFTANGPVNMGTDTSGAQINIGTAGIGRYVVIGNPELASGVNIQANTLGLTLQTTGGAGADILINSDNIVSIEADTNININTPGGPINIGTNLDTSAINIGTGGSRAIIIGNNTTGTSLALNTGVDTGVSVSGFSQVNPGVGVTVAVNNNRVGQVSYGGFTTAPNNDLVLTLTNNKITLGSRILITTYINGPEIAVMSLRNLTLAVGSATITLTNTGSAALDANTGVFINYWVLN